MLLTPMLPDYQDHLLKFILRNPLREKVNWEQLACDENQHFSLCASFYSHSIFCDKHDSEIKYYN